MYARQDEIAFKSRKPCSLYGMRFVPGDTILVVLRRDFHDTSVDTDKPWVAYESGTYSSQFVMGLAERIVFRDEVIFLGMV